MEMGIRRYLTTLPVNTGTAPGPITATSIRVT